MKIYLIFSIIILLVIIISLSLVIYFCPDNSRLEKYLNNHSQTPSEFPKLIFQTWKTRDIPDTFRDWPRSWDRQFPDYQHIILDDEDLFVFISEKFPWFLDHYKNYDQHIKRVDAARYFLMYEYGGIYADLDFECLKNFQDLIVDYDVVLGMVNPKSRHAVSNALLISKPKADFWKFVISRLQERSWGTPEYVTGPVFLTDCLRKYRGSSNIKIYPERVFYPLDWERHNYKEYNSLSSDEIRKQFPDAYTITYWTHTW